MLFCISESESSGWIHKSGVGGSRVSLLDAANSYANVLGIPSISFKEFGFPPEMYKITYFSSLDTQCVVNVIDEQWYLNIFLICYCEIKDSPQ